MNKYFFNGIHFHSLPPRDGRHRPANHNPFLINLTPNTNDHANADCRMVCIVLNHEHQYYINIYVAFLSSNGFLFACVPASSIRLSRWQGWFPCRWRNPRAATTDHKGCIIFHRRFEYITNTFLTLVGEHIPSGDYGSILRADVGCKGCHSIFSRWMVMRE